MNVVAYSYKGGSGRTTAAVNIAASLFMLGKKVACIDMDFGAPGMHNVLRRDVPESMKEEFGQLGVQHFFNERGRSANPVDFIRHYAFDYKQNCLNDRYCIRDARHPDEDLLSARGMSVEKYVSGELLYVPAATGEKAIDALSGSTYSTETFARQFFVLKKGISDYFSEKAGSPVRPEDIYCICDCASGITHNSLPVLKLGNAILIFFRWSQQHYEGTKMTAEAVRRWLSVNINALRTRLYKVGSCYPEQSRQDLWRHLCDDNQVITDIRTWLEKTREEVKGQAGHGFHYIDQPIPEEDSMKFTERIVMFTGPEHKFLNELKQAYRKIAATLVEERPKLDLDYQIEGYR